MSILTGSELEFLNSLNANWSRLYHNELARLLKEDDNRRATPNPFYCPEFAMRRISPRDCRWCQADTDIHLQGTVTVCESG
jgi:hypothetical protein